MDDKRIDVARLFVEALGEKIGEVDLPPPVFESMGCEIVAFDRDERYIRVKMPIQKSSLNPYGTMQGGMVVAALDNAIGPLSMLVAPFNVTRRIETEYIRPIRSESGYIYAIARLVGQKGKRLFFEASLEDEHARRYVKATAEHRVLMRK